MKTIIINNYRWFTDNINLYELENNINSKVELYTLTKQELIQFHNQIN
jgi:hypothetical protein